MDPTTKNKGYEYSLNALSPQKPQSSEPKTNNRTVTQMSEVSPILSCEKHTDEVRIIDPLAEIRKISIPHQLLRTLEEFSTRVLREFPPNTSNIIFFGSQNVLLSTVFSHVCQSIYPDYNCQPYIDTIPISSLSFYCDLKSDTEVKEFIKELLAPHITNKQLVFVRALDMGITMGRVATLASSALDECNQFHHFHFLAFYSLNQESLCHRSNISITNRPDMSDYKMSSIAHRKLKAFGYYHDFSLLKSENRVKVNTSGKPHWEKNINHVYFAKYIWELMDSKLGQHRKHKGVLPD